MTSLREVDLQIINIAGGMPGAVEIASSGDLQWRRGPGEAISDFRMRVKASALIAGRGFVVFGGLPQGEEIDD
jgi:hypothetical protein